MAKTSSYPTDDEEKIASEIDGQFLLAKRYLDTIHQRMNQQEELYRTYIDKNNYPHGAMVFDPRVFRVIETITPRMVSNEPTGSFYPQESGDAKTVEILNALIKYDWRRAEMFPKLVNFVKSMLIFGTAFGRTYWDFQERDRTQMVPKKINGRNVWTPKSVKKISVTEFDGPNFEVLNIYDCYPDPNATTLHDMRWFIYRTFKTLDELKREDETRGTGYYKHLDVLEAAVEAKKAQKSDNPSATGSQPANLQYREHRRIMLSTQEFHGKDESNPEIVILRRFTREGWCDYCPEYNTIIREVENPYFHGDLPIVYGVDYPYPGELYGMGEIEPIDRIQRAINAVLNQRLDNVQLTLRTMWKVKKNAGVDLHTLVSAPGNIVTTNDMNAVEALETPDVTGPTFVQTMTYLTSALQNGSGVTDYTVGVGNNKTVGNDTATGTQLIQQEANAQFKLKIQLFNHMAIQRIANQWKDLRVQYTTDEQAVRIVGKDEVQNLVQNTKLSQTTPDGQPVVPGDLQTKAKLEVSSDGSFAFLNLHPDDLQPSMVGDFDFIAVPAIDQLTDPLTTQQNFLSALDRIQTPEWSQMLFRNGKMLNVLMLTEKIFDKLQIGIDGKDVLTDFPQGQNFNFDMPKVAIKFEDLPPDGKVAAAANAGIQLDPKDPQLQQMGTTQIRVMEDGSTPQGAAFVQGQGYTPPPPPVPTGPMNQDQMDQMAQPMQNPIANPLQQAQQQQSMQQPQAAPQQAQPAQPPYGQQ